jgi:UDP-N-acetylmuramoyl-L-alanyl-D-glutamate--2,6-diaminopimelate ligase
VGSVSFNTVIFTNLTRDHLDYHENMKNYLLAKQRLFTDLLWKTNKRPCFAIVNTDDKAGRRLRVADPAVLWTYGKKNADFTYNIKSMDFASTQFEVKTPAGNAEIHLPMSGVHNVMNALAALAAGLSAGVSLGDCCKALSKFTGVPGRLQSVPNFKKVSVLVDYAHTPDALENVLSSISNVRKSLKSNSKIWTIFGCGGDRDKGKRPLMGQIAMKYSDEVIVTSDNPRTEDPELIIKDILAGMNDSKGQKVAKVIIDRKQAIFETLGKVQAGDVVLIAGKGHEDYQIIGSQKIPFSDVNMATEALNNNI